MSEEGEDEGGEVKKKVSGKKLILFIVLPLLLVVGGVVAALFMGLLDPLLGVEETAEGEEVVEEVVEETIDPPGVFYPMEEMTVSLSVTDSRKKTFLVLEVQLEMEDDLGVAEVEAKRPKIIAEFNVFLRELRPEELNGSEGAYLVREELYRRVSQIVAPTPVKDLLLMKILVQ